MVMNEDAGRTKQLTEPKRAIALQVVKNRGGEKGSLRFDFSSDLSKFVEIVADSSP